MRILHSIPYGTCSLQIFYVAGSTGLILQSNGTSWLGVSSGTTQKLYSVFGSSAIRPALQGTIVHNRGAGFVTENNTTSDLFSVH